MFKDTDEALARLEAELLKEDETKKLPFVEDTTEEDWAEETPDEEDELPPEYLYTDTRAADGPVIYQNFSNNYGKDLRNYASGYRAYNSDVTDEDLDTYSEDVLNTDTEKSNTPLILIVCLLGLGIIAMVFVWMFLIWGGL